MCCSPKWYYPPTGQVGHNLHLCQKQDHTEGKALWKTTSSSITESNNRNGSAGAGAGLLQGSTLVGL